MMELSATTNVATNISTNGTSASSDTLIKHTDSSASQSSTVCYLANGKGNGHIDRLNLVLPLTSSATTPDQSSGILSPTSQLPLLNNSSTKEEGDTTNTTDYYGDVDRTPVNTETKDRLFSFSSVASCRTVDSGTESLCSGDGHETDNSSSYPPPSVTDLAADRILKFFASEDSKSNRFAGQRRPTKANIRQTSTEDDDVEDEEDVYSDESTLSESSVSPSAEFAPSPSPLITPESVVAAIDAKIKQRELKQKEQQNRSAMVSADKDVVDGGDNCALAGGGNFGQLAKETVILASPVEDDAQEEFMMTVTRSITGGHLLEVPEEVFEGGEEFEDNESDESDDCPPVRLIRSTSLKTGKTPPGTPRGKKIVRFADALGLDLESVRHIVDDGRPYMPPLAALKDLSLDDEDKRWFFGGNTGGGSGPNVSQISGSAPGGISNAINPLNLNLTLSNTLPSTRPNLRLLFVQPSADPGPFLERVRSHRLCLENCLVSGPSGPSDMFSLTCIVRVLNVGFEKALTLRYTTNEWLTWTDVPASYVPGSCDGFSDKFTVSFHVAVNSNGHQSMMPGQRLLFALRYLAGGTENWDNNMGLNYALIYQRS